MKRSVARCLLFAVLCSASACGGGGGSGGGSSDGDVLFLGACTGTPDEEGWYACVEVSETRDERIDQPLLWQRGCANAEGSYSSGHCSGGSIGCCERTQPEPFRSERTCYYGDGGDVSLLETACTGLGGEWQ